MRDDPPLLRQWLLLKALSNSRLGLTVREMASETGRDEKTIRRDVAHFQRLGFPVEETVGDHGRKSYRIHSDLASPETGFTFVEVLSLYLGRKHLAPLAGTSIGDAAHSALQKVRASLQESARDWLDKVGASLHFTAVGAPDYADKAEVIDQLMLAIRGRQVTFIDYQSQSATEPVPYEIHPLGIVCHRHTMYLVAFSTRHEEVRHFKLDRMQGIKVENFPFHPPAGFDLRGHLAGSFGVYGGKGKVKVKVRFAAAVARYVEEGRWHASQKLNRQRDGSLLAEFCLSSSEEIKRWILSFGRHAEVLEPKSLVIEIQSEANALSKNYTTRQRPKASLNRSRGGGE